MEAQGQQQDQQPYPMASSFPSGHSSEGSIQYQLEVTDIIEEIIHTIKCEQLKYNQELNRVEWIVSKDIKPLINESGVNSVRTILASRLTRIFALSDYDEDFIERTTVAVAEDLIDDFYYNWNKYEVRDTAAASHILHIVTDTVYATLRKAKDGNYLTYLSKTHITHEMQNSTVMRREAPEQNVQANPLSLLGGFFKKRK